MAVDGTVERLVREVAEWRVEGGKDKLDKLGKLDWKGGREANAFVGNAFVVNVFVVNDAGDFFPRQTTNTATDIVVADAVIIK